MRAAAERACALAPEHSWAHQLRSVALHGLGHHASAAAAARQAVKLDPENPSALVTLVQALLSQNTVASRRQAHRAADRALRLAPERSDVRRANAWVHARLRDTGKARGFLHSALAEDPTDTNAQLDLAVLDIRRMRPTRAAWRLAAIADGDPTSPLGLPALQSVAALWLRYLCAAVSVLYALAVPVGAAPIPDPGRARARRRQRGRDRVASAAAAADRPAHGGATHGDHSAVQLESARRPSGALPRVHLHRHARRHVIARDRRPRPYRRMATAVGTRRNGRATRSVDRRWRPGRCAATHRPPPGTPGTPASAGRNPRPVPHHRFPSRGDLLDPPDRLDSLSSAMTVGR